MGRWGPGVWLQRVARRPRHHPSPPPALGSGFAAVKRNCETILDGQLMLRVLGTGDLHRSFPHSAGHFRRAAAGSSSQATTALGSGSFLSFSAAGPAHHTSAGARACSGAQTCAAFSPSNHLACQAGLVLMRKTLAALSTPPSSPPAPQWAPCTAAPQTRAPTCVCATGRGCP